MRALKNVPLTNTQVIRIWKDKEKIKKRIAENLKKYKRLGDSIQRDQAKLMVVDTGGELELHHGQLLSIAEYKSTSHKGTKFESKHHGANIGAIAQDNKRAARIYLNAHNETTYGAHIYDYSLNFHDRSREKWLGADWKSFDKLLETCIKYVALGEIKKELIVY